MQKSPSTPFWQFARRPTPQSSPSWKGGGGGGGGKAYAINMIS